MEVFLEILFLIVMAWSIPNSILLLIKLIKENPKILPFIISVIISIAGLVFSITFLKNIDFFWDFWKKKIFQNRRYINLYLNFYWGGIKWLAFSYRHLLLWHILWLFIVLICQKNKWLLLGELQLFYMD